MEPPENRLTDFIDGSEKTRWRPVNNHNINNFTEDEIKRITNNYSTPIGSGGFGQVYQGALNDGTTVAVKKYTFQNLKEGFAKEIIVHCQIDHKNVVRLLGFCSEENALMIVTEYVPKGNLKDLLHGNDAPISLDARLQIAIECADALGYMHSSMYQPTIHGDIKPDNILLDNNLAAKLSDFGLSRLLSMDQTLYTMHVAGSRGYMDPEYIETGRLDPKSDVYSFGVVLLEIITRAKASTPNKSGFSTGLKRNFTDAHRKGHQEVWKMFDSEITNERNIDILEEIGNLAIECFTRDIKERPQMKEVQERLQVLRRALHSEEAQEKIGQGPSCGMQDITIMMGTNGKNISSSSSKSSAWYKLSILDIFNKNARRYNQIAGPILEIISNLNIFTKSSLNKITHNYSQPIGEYDAYGHAYLGHTESYMVVVKRSKFHAGGYDASHVARAIQSLSSISHTNILKLVGCCLETEVPMLVYEFAHHNGSLRELLHGNNGNPCLSLDLRLDIAIGAAEAFAYLHSMKPTKIVHGNVTSANIWLDHDFVPRVSSIFPFPGIMLSFTTDEIMLGSSEYVDLVYINTGLLTTKTDVFSFGIVLLELITRKRPQYREKRLQLEYINVCKNENSGKCMFDKEIAVQGNIAILEEMGKLATQCLKKELDERPEMVEVVERLQNLKRDWKQGGLGLQELTISC